MHSRLALAVLIFAVLAAPADVAGSGAHDRVEFNCEGLGIGSTIHLKSRSNGGYVGWVDAAKNKNNRPLRNPIVTYEEISPFTKWIVTEGMQDKRRGNENVSLKAAKGLNREAKSKDSGDFLSMCSTPTCKLQGGPSKGVYTSLALAQGNVMRYWKWDGLHPCQVRLVNANANPDNKKTLGVCSEEQCGHSENPLNGHFVVAGSPGTLLDNEAVFDVEVVAPHH